MFINYVMLEKRGGKVKHYKPYNSKNFYNLFMNFVSRFFHDNVFKINKYGRYFLVLVIKHSSSCNNLKKSLKISQNKNLFKSLHSIFLWISPHYPIKLIQNTWDNCRKTRNEHFSTFVNVSVSQMTSHCDINR